MLVARKTGVGIDIDGWSGRSGLERMPMRRLRTLGGAGCFRTPAAGPSAGASGTILFSRCRGAARLLRRDRAICRARGGRASVRARRRRRAAADRGAAEFRALPARQRLGRCGVRPESPATTARASRSRPARGAAILRGAQDRRSGNSARNIASHGGARTGLGKGLALSAIIVAGVTESDVKAPARARRELSGVW